MEDAIARVSHQGGNVEQHETTLAHVQDDLVELRRALVVSEQRDLHDDDVAAA